MRISWAQFALEHLDELYECLPSHLTAKYGDRHTAIRDMHFPGSWADAKRLVHAWCSGSSSSFTWASKVEWPRANGGPTKSMGPW